MFENNNFDLDFEALKRKVSETYGIIDNTIMPLQNDMVPTLPNNISSNSSPQDLLTDDGKELKKTDIIVPKGVRYVGEMNSNGKIVYELKDYPYPHILNKVLTGCGFTEYCIRNEQDLILCSPRKLLLENKEEQHPEDNVFYARNETEEEINYERTFSDSDGKKEANKFMKETSSSTVYAKKSSDDLEKERKEKQKKILDFKDRVKSHFFKCKIKRKPCKILVTYDSFRHVKEALEESDSLKNFQIVVDEFQSIFVDCKFKSNTELELLNQLSGINKVCFVSATPMIDKYLKRIDEFKDLPYFKFDWEKEDPGRIIKPNLRVVRSRKISKELETIIENYKEGKFEKESRLDDQGMIQEIESKEAVLYVNSVATICSTINKCELLPEQCNVLVSRTDENEEKVRTAFNKVFDKLGLKRKKFGRKDKVIGSVPTEGQPHKMFTFCTRTVYLGADFYSTNARTFIFSDSNINCLCVDVYLDLPQILGRQRLEENPWKNSADIYIKTTITKLTREDFNDLLKQKINATTDLLETFNLVPHEKQFQLSRVYEIASIHQGYSENYIAVNHHAGKEAVPVFNKLMLVAEERAFDIQQTDYADRVSIFNTLRGKGYVLTDIEKDLNSFNSLPRYSNKMEFICIYSIDPTRTKEQFEMLLNAVPKSFKNYFTVLGPERCKANKYRQGDMEREYQMRLNNQGVSLDDRIYDTFHAGDRLTNSAIKDTLTKIYQDSGFQRSFVRATDLNQWFVTKNIQFRIKGTKNKECGLELISRTTPPPPSSNP